MFGNTPEKEPLTLRSKVEAILYYKAQEVSIKDLASITGASPKEVKVAVKDLQNSLQDRGLSVVQHGNKVALVTDERASEIITSFQKQEDQKPLSKSALETLSIVAYKGPIGRADIDYVRGVNSTYALRNLILRGLVQKVQDNGATRYSPTLEALRFMGVEDQGSLPHFDELNSAADGVIDEEKEIEKEKESTVFGEEEAQEDTKDTTE